MSGGQGSANRKLAQWVLYHDAWIELADLFESRGNTIRGAHADAARCIQEQLEEGTLRSRTLDHEAFELRFDAPTLSQEWHLGDAGEIPREFWTFFFATVRRCEEDFRRGISLPVGEGDEATIGESSVRFVRRSELKEDGVLIGIADDVLLFRPDIVQLGRRRGERDAVYDYQDLPAAERVIEAMKAGVERAVAIKAEAKHLDGSDPVARLRKKVRERLRGIQIT